jgi:hypothetical protein
MGKKRRGRGEGEVEQLPSGHYRARVTRGIDPATGKRVRESATFPTKQEALEWRASRLLGGLAAAGTLGDWLTRWLEFHKTRTSAGTFRPTLFFPAHGRLHQSCHGRTLPFVSTSAGTNQFYPAFRLTRV